MESVITIITIKCVSNDIETSLCWEFMNLLQFAYRLRCPFSISRLEDMDSATRELFMDRFYEKQKVRSILFSMIQNELMKQGWVRNNL
jgi:hypothetical protein